MLIVHSHPRPDRFAPAPWSADHPDWRALDQRLPVGHLARGVARGVAQLDLTPLFAGYGPTGSPAHPPDRLLMVVLYELRQGRLSPAQWCRDARECEPLRWLLRAAAPSRSCWYAFRERVAPLLDRFHRQVLAQAQQQGLTPARRGAVDGTSIAADAGRRRLVNEATLLRRREQLEQALQGQTPLPPWIAPTPRGRQRQHARLQHAQQIMADRKHATATNGPANAGPRTRSCSA